MDFSVDNLEGAMSDILHYLGTSYTPESIQ